jgi:hypothetical protein
MKLIFAHSVLRRSVLCTAFLALAACGGGGDTPTAPGDGPPPVSVPTPSASPVPGEPPSPAPTATPQPTATPSPDPTPTAQPTAMPSPEPTSTPQPTITPSPGPTPTPQPTTQPTSTPTPVPTTSPAPIAADYTLVTEMGADFKASLFAVRTDGTGKVLLDQGAYDHQYGKIADGRVFFDRPETPAPTSPSSDRDIYSINLDGTDRRQLTSGPDDDHIAAIVGDRIVIERIPPTAPNNYSRDLVSVRLDGSDLRVLADNLEREERIAFLPPTGKRLLIDSRKNPESNLYAINTDGSVPTTIAESQADETFKALLGNTVVFEEAKTTTAQSGQSVPVIQVNARNFVDGSGLTMLSDGTVNQHRYVGSVGERVVIWSQNTQRVETVKMDGTDRRPLLEQVPAKPYLHANILFFERKDAFDVQQVYGFSLGLALQGVKKPPVQLTHASTKSFIRTFAPAELQTIVVYRPSSLEHPSASLYALRFGNGGIQETLLVNNAGTLYSNFVHQGRLIFRRQFEHFYSVKLDGTGLVELVTQPGPFSVDTSVGIAGNGRLIVTRGNIFAQEQVFAVNADGSNAVPLTALSPEAAWVGY